MQDVFVIAATNAPARLDESLLRPGRLDVRLYVAPPDQDERLAILRTPVLPHLSQDRQRVPKLNTAGPRSECFVPQACWHDGWTWRWTST